MHVSNNCPTNVYYVDVAIKSYATSTLTGITFDGFIDCTSGWSKGKTISAPFKSTDSCQWYTVRNILEDSY